MTLNAQIQVRVKKLANGKIFGYSDLGIAKKNYQAGAKAIECFQANGTIKKLSKVVFYKPEQTVFGELKPEYSEQLKQYLYKNVKRIAYVTVTSQYNQLSLTTQIAFRIKITYLNNRITINRGSVKADSVKSYADVTDNNYELLGFLDAFKDIKQIPDSSVNSSVKILTAKI